MRNHMGHVCFCVDSAGATATIVEGEVAWPHWCSNPRDIASPLRELE